MAKKEKAYEKEQLRKSPEEILNEKIMRIQQGREWRRSLLELLLFLAVVYVTFTCIIGTALVRGNSMSPNLKEGEILLFYRLDKQYNPGDIVLIRMAEQTEYVKRIVAVEGDVVDLDAETGKLLINGEVYIEPYIYTKTYAVSDKIPWPLEVKEGQVFVLGDNREISKDSREFGCVSLSQITGRVLLHVGHTF